MTEVPCGSHVVWTENIDINIQRDTQAADVACSFYVSSPDYLYLTSTGHLSHLYAFPVYWFMTYTCHAYWQFFMMAFTQLLSERIVFCLCGLTELGCCLSATGLCEMVIGAL